MQQSSQIMSLSLILLPSVVHAITAATETSGSMPFGVQTAFSMVDGEPTPLILPPGPCCSDLPYAMTIIDPSDSVITIDVDIQLVAKPTETDPQVILPHATPTIALGLEMPSNTDILSLNPKFAAWAATKTSDPLYISALSVLSTAIPTSLLNAVHNSHYAYQGSGPITEAWFTALPNDVQAMVWSVAHEERTLITKMPVVPTPKLNISSSTIKTWSSPTLTREVAIETESAKDSAATSEKSRKIVVIGVIMAALGSLVVLY